MEAKKLRHKIFQEINKIPDEHVLELFNVIHHYRQRITLPEHTNGSVLAFAGSWRDMPFEDFSSFMNDIESRRNQAYSWRG